VTVTTPERPDRKLGPESWDDYQGQAALKARLETLINAAIVEERALDHILLAAPPGTGKTTLASLIAARLGDPIVFFNRPLTIRQLINELYRLGPVGLVFLDEVHLYNKKVLEQMLGLLEEGTITADWGALIEFPHITVIAATTEPERLPPAFVDRFVVPPFEDYTINDLASIVDQMMEQLDVPTDDCDLPFDLAEAAAGSPRQARKLVRAAKALSHQGVEAVTLKGILDHTAIERDGLGPDHMAYLRLLDRLVVPTGLEIICDSLQMHRSRVVTLERLLVARGLMLRTKGGRVLTTAGKRRVAETETGANVGRHLRRPLSS
jgi:holliday junction DNA helicase RuvB